MTDLVVIVPSRGRPEAARALAQHFMNTAAGSTTLMFAVDADDPRGGEYDELGAVTNYVSEAPSSMVRALNTVALSRALAEDSPFAIGFCGDDHRFRTYGWDVAYLKALRELGTGIVYGDDLLQGEKLPTQCAMTSDIVRALGYMAPPTLTHMYVDNVWRDLGTAADCLRYLPDVVVEHMHPIAGKAEWTEGHRRVNTSEMYAKDEAAYLAYLAGQFRADVAKIKALRAAVTS